jgi:hypothetical protein
LQVVFLKRTLCKRPAEHTATDRGGR